MYEFMIGITAVDPVGQKGVVSGGIPGKKIAHQDLEPCLLLG
jgi:hypothetical protein